MQNVSNTFFNKNGEKIICVQREVGKRGGEVVVVGDWVYKLRWNYLCEGCEFRYFGDHFFEGGKIQYKVPRIAFAIDNSQEGKYEV